MYNIIMKLVFMSPIEQIEDLSVSNYMNWDLLLP